MSDNFSSRSKSSRGKKEKGQARSKTKSKYSDNNCSQMESRTPPLPVKNTSTLEELIKKRESLKQELKNIVKYNESASSKDSKKRKHSKEETSNVKLKKSYKENKTKPYDNSIKKHARGSSPELENDPMDSEDEETIIQARRQQRKQLVANFETSFEEVIKHDSKIEKTNSNITSIQTIENQRNSKQITDMFSEKDEFEAKTSDGNLTQDENDTNLNLVDNWDDPEGYYNVRVGDVINNKYTVKGLLGQGVFANVVRAQDNTDGNDYVAIKIIRNNDLMYRTSLKEIVLLKEIKKADPENKYHCVQLLGNFMHKGHLCIILESLHMDLRAVIKKYGKHDGLNMKALSSYSRQLLVALRLLKKLGIIHADIKPDNILVNEKKNLLKLCDFGSASKVGDNEPTPYLVSRFYRAPEIILGVPYKHSVDVWSAACTIFEMATGKILFTGNSNNKMLKCFMDLKGRFSSKFIKRGKFKDQHFNYNSNFLLHKKDEFTGREKVVEISNIMPSRDLYQELKKCYKYSTSTDDKKLNQLKDLLDKMTILDSSHRISVTDCLKHQFIIEDSSTCN